MARLLGLALEARSLRPLTFAFCLQVSACRAFSFVVELKDSWNNLTGRGV
jgi:hypothetical protein